MHSQRALSRAVTELSLLAMGKFAMTEERVPRQKMDAALFALRRQGGSA
jgi:hypothetical protein